MQCHYGTNNREPRWTITDPCKPEVRPGAREEAASPNVNKHANKRTMLIEKVVAYSGLEPALSRSSS